MFINDQWMFSELSNVFMNWMESYEEVLTFVGDHELLVFF